MDTIKKLYNKEFRQKFVNEPNKYIKDLGYSNDIEVKVVRSTKDITYFAIFDPALLSKDILNKVSAAGLDNVSTAGTAGTVGTVGTVLFSTAGTLGSFGTLGSAGTVSDPK